MRADADTNVEALAAAFNISRLASELVALSGPTRFGRTQEDISKAAVSASSHKTALAAQLEILAETNYGKRPGEIARLVDDQERVVKLSCSASNFSIFVIPAKAGIQNRLLSQSDLVMQTPGFRRKPE